MGLKDYLLSRIEKDAIKIRLEGKYVYLKKSSLFGLLKEWRVIYPPVDPETGKWDMVNLIFGGKSNMVKTIFVVVIVLLITYGIYEILKTYQEVFSNPVVQSCLNMLGVRLI